MAVKLRSVSTGKKTTSTELPVILPAGAAEKDFAVMLCTALNVGGSWTTPTGWTLVETSNESGEGASEKTWAIFTRKLTGTTGENLPTIKYSVSAQLEYDIVLAEVGTFDTTTPVDTHSTGWTKSPASAPLEITIADGTTSVAGDLAILFLSESQTPTIAPTGYTVQQVGSNSMTYTRAELGASEAVNAPVTKNTKQIYNGFIVVVKATSAGEGVTVSLNAAASTSSASLAANAMTAVSPASAEATSSASLTATARTTVALAPASSTSSASASVTAATRVTLAVASSTSSATLAAHAITLVSMNPASSVSAAVALVTVPTQVLLDPASSTSAASLTVGVPPTVALDPARSVSSASATITSPIPAPPEPPTQVPEAGYVAVGRAGRLPSGTGRIATPASGRARR